jgi:hypothetical protein
VTHDRHAAFSIEQEQIMKKAILSLAIGGLFAAVATLPARADISQADYKAGKDRIESSYKAAKIRCAPLNGNGKDICQAEAKGEYKVAKADLEAEYKATDKNRYDARLARADAAYEVAKERCDDKKGNDKDVCVKEAKATFTQAKADAKANKQVAQATDKAAETKLKADDKLDKKVSEARQDATESKVKAELKVALEKCDALSGDRKDACVADAKTKYPQS